MKTPFISKRRFLADLFSNSGITLERDFIIRIIRFLRRNFYLNSHNFNQGCSHFDRIAIFHIHIINCFDLFFFIPYNSHSDFDVLRISFYKLSLFSSQSSNINYCFFYYIAVFFSHFSQVKADLKLRDWKGNNIWAKTICFIHIFHVPSNL